jgi:hypothetical protein
VRIITIPVTSGLRRRQAGSAAPGARLYGLLVLCEINKANCGRPMYAGWPLSWPGKPDPQIDLRSSWTHDGDALGTAGPPRHGQDLGDPPTAFRGIGSVAAGGERSRCIVMGMEQRHTDEKLDEAVEAMRSDAEEMQQRSTELGDRIEDARSDWHAKQQDDSVPGARPPLDDEAEHPPSKAT